MYRSVSDEFLVFGAPQFLEAEIQEVVDCLRSGWVGTGPKVARFERDFSEYKGVKTGAVAVNSCTAALHLSMIAAGLKPGDEVITTALTFCSTVNAIIHSGATPVLADIDPKTMNIDPRQVARKITPRTRAIVPVHFGGRPCEMDMLSKLCQEHNLLMIEDCAHAVEAEYNGIKTGCFGDFGCFSFYVTKNMTTAEGGMILARRSTDADSIKVLALHGMSKDAWKRYRDEGYQHYSVIGAGFKYNMTDIQAALGIHQLARIESNWLRRQQIWQRYNEAFAELPVSLPSAPANGTRHAYHLYHILIDEERVPVSRDVFLGRMTAMRIGVGVHYLSIPEHPYYRERFGWQPDDFPHAKRIGRQTVSIPLSPFLSDDDVERVIQAVKSSLKVATS